ncbi:MAG: hypothetical protein KF774_04065 [Planctomyces sp.]|nr:hypothetical protein [Planctomyces sp.]
MMLQTRSSAPAARLHAPLALAEYFSFPPEIARRLGCHSTTSRRSDACDVPRRLHLVRSCGTEIEFVI